MRAKKREDKHYKIFVTCGEGETTKENAAQNVGNYKAMRDRQLIKMLWTSLKKITMYLDQNIFLKNLLFAEALFYTWGYKD